MATYDKDEFEDVDDWTDDGITHRTKDGKLMLLSEMSDSHLENTIRMIERKAREGVERRWGIYDGDGIDGDVETLTGAKALEYMDHGKYIAERERRAKCKPQ